jgi:hypothetical protein
MGPLETEIVEKLQQIGLETSDRVVHTALFRIIAAQGAQSFQERLLELAVNPGRLHVRRAVAFALLSECNTLDFAVIRAIKVDTLATTPPPIAVMLTLIAAARLASDERLELARGISASPTRRVLLLLMLWPALRIDEPALTMIQNLLPDGHPSLSWVKQGPSELADDDLIADLGDAALCREVLDWMNPTQEKS